MSSFYTPTPSSDMFLMHFGILGQKWGKRQGPPYPLSAGDHSAAEKKAGYTKSKEGKRNTKDYAETAAKAVVSLDPNRKVVKKGKVIAENASKLPEKNKRLKGALGKKMWNQMSKEEQDKQLKKELKAETDREINREKELEDKARTQRIKGNERELKNWSKTAKEKPQDYLDKYEDEFRKSPKGKELLKKFSDVYDEYMYDDSGDPELEKRFSIAEDDLLRETQKYAVDKFFKSDAGKFTPQQMAYDQYPFGQRVKAVNEQDVKDYLLNEQWKLHRM